MSEKERFDYNCEVFKKELEDTKKYIKEEYNNEHYGTLKDIGLVCGYEVANYGFELGYMCWFFNIYKNDKKKTTELFYQMIEEDKSLE